MENYAAPRRQREGTSRASMRSLVGPRVADPGVTTEPRGHTEATSRPADVFTTAAVPGRGAVLDECVASYSAVTRTV